MTVAINIGETLINDIVEFQIGTGLFAEVCAGNTPVLLFDHDAMFYRSQLQWVFLACLVSFVALSYAYFV